MALLVGELRSVLDLDTSKYDKGLDRSHARFGKFVKGAAIASAAAAVAAGAGLLNLAKGAAEDEKAQGVLAKTLKNTARATDAQVASIEEYITKTGAAKGVTDDEMRPALANLVRATKDVGKAQSLMGLAMDVSAGTGKDLGAVSMALAKAQNGNVGALGKLGIATKDAHGKTKSFEQIQKDLAKTFTGQSAAAAETTSGKYARLRLIMAEAGESIGAKVLPVLLALGNFLLRTVVPAVVTFGTRVQIRMLPVLRLIGAFIAEQIVPRLKTFAGFLVGTVIPAVVAFSRSVLAIGQRVLAAAVPAVQALVAALMPLAREIAARLPGIFSNLRDVLGRVGTVLQGNVIPALHGLTKFLKENAGLVRAVAVGVGAMVLAFYAYRAALGVVALATRAYAAVQAALNVVMALNPIGIVILALVGLAAGLVYAYKHSEKFRKIVDGAFRAVSKVVTTVVGAVVNFFRDNWKRLPLLLTGPIGLVLLIFKGLPGKILQALGNLGRLLVQKGRDLISGLWTGLGARWKDVGNWLADRRNSVVRWIGSVSRLLYQKGRDVISGFWTGLGERWRDVTKWVGGIAKWIKDHKGPVSLDGRLLVPAGRAIMSGFLTGLKSGAGPAWSFVKSVGGRTKEAVAEAYGWVKGIGWVNDLNLPADVAAGVLGGPNRRVFYQGEAFDLVTYQKLAKAMQLAGAINVTQGGYESASSYSGTTHTGGGVFDVVGGNLSRTLAALKSSGLIGWIRNPSQGPWPWHIHALDPSDTGRMSSSARAQVASYYRGGNGLGGYRNGGWLMPGQLAYNETRTPEPILNQSQWNILARQAGGGGTTRLDPASIDALARANKKAYIDAMREAKFRVVGGTGGSYVLQMSNG